MTGYSATLQHARTQLRVYRDARALFDLEDLPTEGTRMNYAEGVPPDNQGTVGLWPVSLEQSAAKGMIAATGVDADLVVGPEVVIFDRSRVARRRPLA